jgi:hypothetical protein
MYYRVAIQKEPSAPWQWKSTALSSLDTLWQWFRLYSALPQDRLRVFTTTSREEMHEQLARENQGLRSTSVPAAQFLRQRAVRSPEQASCGTRTNERTANLRATNEQPLTEASREASLATKRWISQLEERREELERGAGGDHDVPYVFALPTCMSQMLAWMRLLAKIQIGELRPEVLPAQGAPLVTKGNLPGRTQSDVLAQRPAPVTRGGSP